MTAFLSLLIASTGVSFTSLLCIFFLKWQQLWTEKVTGYMVSFAAGTMLSVAFLDLLPEALHTSQGKVDIFLPTFLGIVLFFFLERFVLWFHHHDSEHGAHPTPLLVLIGDSVHNTIDGIAIAAAFLASPGLGFAITLAIAAHEIPQEIAHFSVLVHGGMEKNKAFLYNFLTALFATAGAVGSYFFLEKIENILPILLAFTAGMFTYIACSDLIPEMHIDFRKQRSWTQLIPFVSGLALLGGLVALLEK